MSKVFLRSKFFLIVDVVHLTVTCNLRISNKSYNVRTPDNLSNLLYYKIPIGVLNNLHILQFIKNKKYTNLPIYSKPLKE